MGEYVHEKLPTRLQRSCDLPHQELVIFHVLEQLDRYDSIESSLLEFVVYHVSRNELEIQQALRLRFLVDICFLSPRIGKSCDLRIWEKFSKVKRSRAPAAPSMTVSYSCKLADSISPTLGPVFSCHLPIALSPHMSPASPPRPALVFLVLWDISSSCTSYVAPGTPRELLCRFRSVGYLLFWSRWPLAGCVEPSRVASSSCRPLRETWFGKYVCGLEVGVECHIV